MRGNMEYISKPEPVGQGRGNIFHISEYLGDILLSLSIFLSIFLHTGFWKICLILPFKKQLEVDKEIIQNLLENEPY